MAKRGFEQDFGKGDAEFLTPLSEKSQGKEPGPQQLVVSIQGAPDPLGIVDYPGAPLRKINSGKSRS